MAKQASQDRQSERVAPRAAWDAIAADYDRNVTPRGTELPTAALRLAGICPGHRFLDVAAGSGALSLAAAGLGARVVATDWSPTMIECFRARARDLELPDAESYVMDCHDLRFPDDEFDVTGSQFGVMLVPDQATALREMVRVTRPGGRVVVIGFNAPDHFEALQLFIGAIRTVVPDFPGLPGDPPPLEFQLANPDEFRRRLTNAGLTDVQVTTDHQNKLEIPSGQDLWDWCLSSNPIPGMLISDLSVAQRAEVRKALDQAMAERKNGRHTAILTAAVNIGLGTK